MDLYIVLILLLIVTAFLWKTKTLKVIYIRKMALPLLSLAFILCLILFSKTAVNSALKGINLWLYIVFPSLFPFFVASEMLNGTGFIKAVGILLEPVMRPLFNVPGCGSFAFAMGITSGYPVGAKITAEMRRDNFLTKKEAERLLAFTNNSGPLFIIGAVATGMFKIPQVGFLLLGCHIAACITVGILFGFYGREKRKNEYGYNRQLLSRFKKELLYGSSNTGANFGTTFGNAVKNSVMLLFAIGGFIILFSVIINLLLETGFIRMTSSILSPLLIPFGVDANILSAVISGFFEITTGTSLASSISHISLFQKLIASSMIIGWAGLSVHAQVLSITSSTDISIKPYLFGKFLQGIFSAVYTYIVLLLSRPLFTGDSPVFFPFGTPSLHHWQDYFVTSCKYLAVVLTLLFIRLLAAFIFDFFINRKPSGVKR